MNTGEALWEGINTGEALVYTAKVSAGCASDKASRVPICPLSPIDEHSWAVMFEYADRSSLGVSIWKLGCISGSRCCCLGVL